MRRSLLAVLLLLQALGSLVYAAEPAPIPLKSLTTAANAHYGIDYHPLAKKLVVSANTPTGKPHNFELIAADGKHSRHSNLNKVPDELILAVVREASASNDGKSVGGFEPGELFFAAASSGIDGSRDGVIGKVSPDGSRVHVPWVSLPRSTDPVDEGFGWVGGLHVDTTGSFGGDLIAVTGLGEIWRINAQAVAKRVADAGAPLHGVLVVPDQPDRYGPWAGKILSATVEENPALVAVDAHGAIQRFPLDPGVNDNTVILEPRTPVDLEIVPSHQNFFAVHGQGLAQKLSGIAAADLSAFVGDVIVAINWPTSADLRRVTWDGSAFVMSNIAYADSWTQIAFAPVGVAEIKPDAPRTVDKVAVVRHAPDLDSGRVEGNLWQLLGEGLTLNGTDTITGDLLVPGTPTVTATEAPFFGGVVQGPGSPNPTGYPITITGRATLHRLTTRTDPVPLPTVAPPPTSAGTKDVPNDIKIADIKTKWSTIRNVRLSGNDGAVAVPAGTYGRFFATGKTAFIFGVAGATTPSTYNLEELDLSGASELRVVGPIILTVRERVTLSGNATAGASGNSRNLALRISNGGLTMSGGSVAYALVRAPQGQILIEGSARLRGTVATDQLRITGNGVLQVTENDVPPPNVNRPPVVDAGPDQTITLPTNTVTLDGVVTDDGLPTCPCAVTGWCCFNGPPLTITWSVVSGPGPVTFANAASAVTTATFTTPGTYVLRLTASDSALSSSDETTITVIQRNTAPVVDAGPDQEVTLPNSASLAGTVVDDGLPLNSTVTTLWTVVSGPGPVTFENPQSAATTASFTVPGPYVLRLTANDGEFAASDQLTVIVHPSNQPPEVSAGPDQIIIQPANSARLSGSVTDDGMPAGVPLTVTWTQLSGPVQATFSDPSSPVTTATFTEQGTYVLRLTADDSQFEVSDDVQVSVGCSGSTKPLDVVLVIDESGSMAGSRLGDAVTAARSFIDNLDLTVDQVGVVSFDSNPHLRQTLTHDGEAAKASLGALFPLGGTNIAAGISAAQTELTSVRHNPGAVPVMIVLSDGESSLDPAVVAANAAKAAGTRIIAIAISTVAPETMRAIVSSPSDFFVTASSEDLAWIYAYIAGSICRNGAPLARAGLDFEVTLPNTATLQGEVRDDGLPVNSHLTSEWTVVSGPAPVNFFDAAAPVTTVAFTQPGTYELKLTTTDSLASSSDTVLVTVRPEPSLQGAFLTLAASGTGRYVIGTTATLTATLRDSSGAPIANFPVNYFVTGSNTTTAAVATNASGVATFALKGTVTGTDTVEARAEGRTTSARSNLVTLEWTQEAPPGTPPPVPSTTQGWIGGPVHGSTVTGTVPITVGAGISIVQGVVEYWSISSPTQVTVLASNITAGPGATIAALDTTLLANGSYIVRLRAKNAAAQQSAALKVRNLSSGNVETMDVATATELVSDVLVVVVGENKPGRIGLSATDFTVPLSGVPIAVRRSYDSLNRLRSGDFGFGWSLEIGSPRLEVNPANGVTLTDPSTGRRVSFAFVPRSFGVIFLAFFTFPSFEPEPGEFGTLTSDGCSLLMKVGGQLTCAFSIDPFRPTVYQYTDREGRSYMITADGLLRSAKDLNGNTLTFATNGITSNTGLSIPFFRDTQGRITQINDPLGRQYRYAYDTAGNLSTVTLPGIATPIRYTYDPGHRYLTSTDPRGNVAVTTTYTADGRMESMTDAVGNTTRYAYNLAENTTTTTNPDGGVVVERFNASGLPVRITDPLGNVTEYEYDASLNVITEKNALGQITRYTYDEGGNQTSITDPGGRVSRTTYNEFGRPATLRDELGEIRTILYDGNANPIGVADSLGTLRTMTVDRRGNPMTVTDSNGATTHYTYDELGRLFVQDDALGNGTTYTYDAMSRILTTTDPRGNVTTFTYDPLGNMLTRVNALSQTTTYTYDANSNRSTETDPLLRKTTFEYDAANRLTKTTFANNTFTSSTYDFRGNKLTETDAAGRVTTHTYDLAGRRVKTRHPDGAEKTFAYDAIGRKIRETDERGNATTFEYDAACACGERLTKVTDPLGRVTTRAFDGAGRLVTVKDPAGRETRFKYDVRDRVTEVTHADGTTITRTYDGESRPLTETNQAGDTTTYVWDPTGNLISVTNPLGETTTYTWDGTHNLTAAAIVGKNTRLFEYDRLNRLTRRRNFGRVETVTYDAAGNITALVDFNGRRTTYDYDALNRLTARRPDPILAEPPVLFTYTPTGARATMVDGTGTSTYTYDLRDRMTAKQTPQGTLSYTYDPASNVLTLRSSNTSGASANYAYDAANRLTTVTENGPTAGTTTYVLDVTDNVTSRTTPNGVQTALTYNAVNRITSVTLSRGAAILAGYTYGLGPRGERTSVAERSGRQIAYTYDAATRLVAEAVTGAASGNGRVDYTFDTVGNRLTRTSTLPGVVTATYSYTADERLSGDTYNANGNTLASGGKTFTYDFENRLKSIGTAVTYSYDGDGNRVARTAGGVTTRFLVDELSPTGFTQVVEEIVSGAVQRAVTYGYGPISQRSLVSGSWVPRYFGQDGHGSVRLLTDAAGAITDTYDYDAFGILLATTGTSPNLYRFSGERFDADLGAYHLRARDYNPELGRFFTADPFPGYIDTPHTQHPYLYVGADPVNWVDPTGETETFEKVWLRARIWVSNHLPRIPCTLLKFINLGNDVLIIGETVTRVAGVANAVGGAYIDMPNWTRSNNMGVIRSFVRRGGVIVDIGRDPGRIGPPSNVYPAETQRLDRMRRMGHRVRRIRCF